jgi:hypothetical protein
MKNAFQSLYEVILKGATDQQKALKEALHQQMATSALHQVPILAGRLPRKEAKAIITREIVSAGADAQRAYHTIKSILRQYPPKELLDLFFDCADSRLTDPALYWKLMRYVLSQANGSMRHYSNIRKSLSRYGRLKGSAYERIQRSLITESDDALAFYDNLDVQVVVYRGFLVSGTNRIRKSSDRNSLMYFQQSEGGGFSYSLAEDVALFFAGRAAHNYGDQRERMHTKGKSRLSDKQKCFDHFYRGGHPYIGRYLVPKEKIILVVTERGEREIVAMPQDVRLESYRVIRTDEIEERYVRLCPKDFPIPANVEWDPIKFKDLWRQWHKPNMG